MLRVPRPVEGNYKKLMKAQRKQRYLLGELILHKDVSLDDSKWIKQIQEIRKTYNKSARRTALVEESIWKNFSNGAELVKEERKLLKGEL